MFSNSKPRAPVRPINKRRISDSVATRTRARLLVHQAFSSTISPTEEEAPLPDTMSKEVKGERKPVITASALTMYVLDLFCLVNSSSLTLARSSSNPYSPPIDHDKFAMAGLPLASPFHEKKSYFDGGSIGADKQIKRYFGVSKSSKRNKDAMEEPKK